MSRVLKLKQGPSCSNPECTKDHHDSLVPNSMLLPLQATAWFYLARCGGGTVGGSFFPSEQCIEESRKKFDNRDWYNYALNGGAVVAGQCYSSESCYIRSIEIGPIPDGWVYPWGNDEETDYCAASWCNLGCNAGGGLVSGEYVSPIRCYIRALELHPDPDTAANCWCNLGQDGGGVVDGVKYTMTQCHIKAVELQSQGSKARFIAWYQLATLEGGIVAGEYYSPHQCWLEGRHLDPEFLWPLPWHK